MTSWRGHSGRRKAVFSWLTWTGLFGTAPFILIFLFLIVELEYIPSVSDVFYKGDALLVAIALLGGGLSEVFRLPRNSRPELTDTIVPYTTITMVVSAALYGYIWPRVDDPALTPFDRLCFAWASLVVLIASLAVGSLLVWLTHAAEREMK